MLAVVSLPRAIYLDGNDAVFRLIVQHPFQPSCTLARPSLYSRPSIWVGVAGLDKTFEVRRLARLEEVRGKALWGDEFTACLEQSYAGLVHLGRMVLGMIQCCVQKQSQSAGAENRGCLMPYCFTWSWRISR